MEWGIESRNLKLKQSIYGFLPNRPGVYFLFFINNPSRKYYGSTVNLYRRVCCHMNYLIRAMHHNCDLQDEFNKNALSSLRCKIVKIINNTSTMELKLEEDKMIQNDPYCYNKTGGFGQKKY